MSDLSLILLGAGESSRFKLKCKKQWLRIGNIPLWLYVAKNFEKAFEFRKIIITSSKDEINFMKKYADFNFIEGGNSRQESLKNALELVDSEYVLVSDIARACIKKDFIKNIISLKEKADCIAPYINVSDTVVYQNETINRDEIKLIQTPQLSRTEILKKALLQNRTFTDESSAIKAIGKKVTYIQGDKEHHKLTFIDDLKDLKCLEAPSKDILTGIGIDIHPFENNKEMFLGGVKIDKNYGFKAHSDGDVAIHSIIDALLGAAGFGDIGELFPDIDEKYKNADSKELLKKVNNLLQNCGYEIVNIDVTIVAQKPKISPYKDEIKRVLSKLLEIEKYQINIKATTAEKLGAIGRKEGVMVLSTANLKYFNWQKEITK